MHVRLVADIRRMFFCVYAPLGAKRPRSTWRVIRSPRCTPDKHVFTRTLLDSLLYAKPLGLSTAWPSFLLQPNLRWAAALSSSGQTGRRHALTNVVPTEIVTMNTQVVLVDDGAGERRDRARRLP